jgi:uncharacterized membrane protein
MGLPKVTPMSLAKLFVFLLLISMLVVLVMKWRSGTPFERYRNWRAQWVSLADAPEALVLGGVILVVFVAAGVWSWREKRREDRFIKDIKKRRSGR